MTKPHYFSTHLLSNIQSICLGVSAMLLASLRKADRKAEINHHLRLLGQPKQFAHPTQNLVGSCV